MLYLSTSTRDVDADAPWRCFATAARSNAYTPSSGLDCAASINWGLGWKLSSFERPSTMRKPAEVARSNTPAAAAGKLKRISPATTYFATFAPLKYAFTVSVSAASTRWNEGKPDEVGTGTDDVRRDIVSGLSNRFPDEVCPFNTGASDDAAGKPSADADCADAPNVPNVLKLPKPLENADELPAPLLPLLAGIPITECRWDALKAGASDEDALDPRRVRGLSTPGGARRVPPGDCGRGVPPDPKLSVLALVGNWNTSLVLFPDVSRDRSPGVPGPDAVSGIWAAVPGASDMPRGRMRVVGPLKVRERARG
eukprot:Opistho-2@73926